MVAVSTRTVAVRGPIPSFGIVSSPESEMPARERTSNTVWPIWIRSPARIGARSTSRPFTSVGLAAPALCTIMHSRSLARIVA